MCDSVDVANDKALRGLLLDLLDTLESQCDPPGVGLSAPQIGVTKRVFLARIDDNEKAPPVVFINPEYMKVAEEMTCKKESYKRLEGCLSIPDLYGVVLRHAWIEMRYLTLDFDLLKKKDLKDISELLVHREERFDGFMSRVLQHEFDHLNGVLFTQRVLEQGGKLFEVGTDKDGKEVLFELEIG